MSRIQSVARLTLGLTAVAFAGCGGMLKKQVEQDIQLATACQEVEANHAGRVPIGKEAFFKLVRLRVLGEIGDCEAVGGGHMQSVLYCGIEEALILKNFDNVPALQALQTTARGSLGTIGEQIRMVQDGMQLLGNAWEGTQDCNQAADCMQLYQQVAMASAVQIKQINKALQSIGAEGDKLHAAVDKAESELNSAARQDQREIIADVKRILLNMKTFLATGRRVLQGDLAQMTRDAVIDNLYYQLAHRTVDSVEQSLYRAEKLLDKADDKVYGVVSVGLFFGRAQIQASLDRAALSLICRSNANYYWERAKFALAQASCERVNDKSPDRSLYFAPMLEASWVKAVVASSVDNRVAAQDADMALRETCSELYFQATSDAKRRYFWQPKNSLDFDHPEALENAFVDARTFATYLSAEWAAGIALAHIETVEISSGRDTNPARPGDQVKRTLTVANAAPPADVQRVALAASSAVQTEFRAKKAMEETSQSTYSSKSPPTASTSSAAAAPEAFLSNPRAMSEQVNILAGRLNMVNSVENNVRQTQNTSWNPLMRNDASTRVYVGDARAAESGGLCANLPSWLICRRRGDGAVEVESPPFSNGQFSDPSVRNMLRILAAASKSHGAGYTAEITGFASAAELRCQQVEKWGSSRGAALFEGAKVQKGSITRFQYLDSGNALGVDMQCTDAHANHVLSVARAAWAHSVLAGAESIKVQGIGGQGASFADRKDNGHDRRIVIHLTPQ